MAYKHNDQCLAKVGDDEPIFVLRAKDVLAPKVVEYWVRLAIREGVHSDKHLEASNLAQDMRAWQIQWGAKVPD